MQMPRPAVTSLSSALAPAHAQVIANSHERSRAFGLREFELPDLSLMSRAELHLAQQRSHRLCEQARPVMEMLWEQIAHTQSMVVLTDAQGAVLHALGDAEFLSRAQRVALAPGAVWSEAAKGTNAVGTALIEEQPALVHAREHFLCANHFLTCSASPIFDHAGNVLGVIDVSGDQRSYHPHTLALACMSARVIENQWFIDRFRSGLKLHLHPSANGLGTLQEGVVAIDTDSRILGANRCALDMLGRSATQLRHESLESVFGVSLSQMVDHARLSADLPMTLVIDREAARPRGPSVAGAASVALWAGEPGQPAATRGTGYGMPATQTVLCAKLSGDAIGPGPIVIRPTQLARTAETLSASRAPVADPGPHAASAATTLRQQEMAAIRNAVEAAGGNMAKAARSLGIGRSTLYRKLGKRPGRTDRP
jgi:transcriptional regulator of acetoin/glycerol metabolism